MPNPDAILDISGAHYRWPGEREFELSVSRLTLGRGKTVLLLGESGSGKSTLLSLICGTIAPDRGRIAVDGKDLSTLSASARDRFRAERIGVIFQQFNLLPFGTVSDNIALPLSFAPERRARVGDVHAEAAQLMAALGLPPDLLTVRAGRLSVGQQQRVAVARALIGAPPLVIADEPTSALDETSQTRFLDLLFGQVRASGSSLLMVSHDPRLANRFDHVEEMSRVAGAAP